MRKAAYRKRVEELYDEIDSIRTEALNQKFRMKRFEFMLGMIADGTARDPQALAEMALSSVLPSEVWRVTVDDVVPGSKTWDDVRAPQSFWTKGK